MMRITVDIDDSLLREVMRATGRNKKSPAVAEALERFVRDEKCRRLIGMVKEGRTDYGMTNADLERAMGDDIR